MGLAEATTAASAAADAGLAPSVQMLIALVGVLGLLGGPLALFIRDWRRRARRDEAEGRVVATGSNLYQHLSEQVVMLTARIDKITDAHNQLVQENAALRARIAALEKAEETVGRLQAKLSEKDTTIAERDRRIDAMFREIRDRDQKIIDLQDRLNSLEVRVATEEIRLCGPCPYRPASAPYPEEAVLHGIAPET